MRCVRPDLTRFSKRLALRPSERSSCLSAGSSWLVAPSSAARCTALGNTSLDDWPMLTWSLGWAPSPARAAMTSLAFVFVEVPEPVWKTSIGNWPSWSPAATSSAARPIASASLASSLPRSALTRAAAPLMRPSQWITDAGTVSPEMGKLATAFFVSPPYRVFLGAIGPETLATERRKLPRHPDRVVVGDEEARGAQHPQLPVGQQVERLLRGLQRVAAVGVGPQQQHREVQARVEVEQLAPRPRRPALGQPRPRAREVDVAAHVGEGMAHEVAGGGVGAGRELDAVLGAEGRPRHVGQRAIEAGD